MRARGRSFLLVASIQGWMVLSLVACSSCASAHESQPHPEGVESAANPTDAIALRDVTYVGRIETAVAGQPHRTFGHALLEGGRAQVSELRSDGRLLALHEFDTEWTTPALTPFAREADASVGGTLANPLVSEQRPEILVAGQTRDGALALFDRSRQVSSAHPAGALLLRFDEQLADVEPKVPRAGLYLQVLPFLGEGPVDATVSSAAGDVATYVSQPFWLHYLGARPHAVVGEAFVVSPGRPVLVEVGNGRFVFSLYEFAPKPAQIVP